MGRTDASSACASENAGRHGGREQGGAKREALARHQGEARGDERRLGVAAGVAAAEQPRPECRVEQALEPRQAAVAGEAVCVETKLAPWITGRPSSSTVGSRTTPSMWTAAWLAPPIPVLVPNAKWIAPSVFSSPRMVPVMLVAGFVPIPSSAITRPLAPPASSVRDSQAAASPPLMRTARPRRTTILTG